MAYRRIIDLLHRAAGLLFSFFDPPYILGLLFIPLRGSLISSLDMVIFGSKVSPAHAQPNCIRFFFLPAILLLEINRASRQSSSVSGSGVAPSVGYFTLISS